MLPSGASRGGTLLARDSVSLAFWMVPELLQGHSEALPDCTILPYACCHPGLKPPGPLRFCANTQPGHVPCRVLGETSLILHCLSVHIWHAGLLNGQSFGVSA